MLLLSGGPLQSVSLELLGLSSDYGMIANRRKAESARQSRASQQNFLWGCLTSDTELLVQEGLKLCYGAVMFLSFEIGRAMACHTELPP
jgi:hypothetical protein